MQEIQISMREVQGKSKKGLNSQHSILLMFVIAHLQRVVCMHNEGFNLQYCYHVRELSGFHILCQHTQLLVTTFIPTKTGK